MGNLELEGWLQLKPGRGVWARTDTSSRNATRRTATSTPWANSTGATGAGRRAPAPPRGDRLVASTGAVRAVTCCTMRCPRQVAVPKSLARRRGPLVLYLIARRCSLAAYVPATSQFPPPPATCAAPSCTSTTHLPYHVFARYTSIPGLLVLHFPSLFSLHLNSPFWAPIVWFAFAFITDQEPSVLPSSSRGFFE